jgi:hypothetical protein
MAGKGVSARSRAVPAPVTPRVADDDPAKLRRVAVRQHPNSRQLPTFESFDDRLHGDADPATETLERRAHPFENLGVGSRGQHQKHNVTLIGPTDPHRSVLATQECDDRSPDRTRNAELMRQDRGRPAGQCAHRGRAAKESFGDCVVGAVPAVSKHQRQPLFGRPPRELGRMGLALGLPDIELIPFFGCHGSKRTRLPQQAAPSRDRIQDDRHPGHHSGVRSLNSCLDDPDGSRPRCR